MFTYAHGTLIKINMTENYPEFLVANLNYAGGHAGHQI
jgi:hypothetical protein